MKARTTLAAVLAAATLMFSATAMAIAARDYGTDLRQHRADILTCAGTSRGEVTLEIGVSGRGRLQQGSVVAASSDEMRRAGECVLREARGWTFQRSSSGGGGRYAITLAGDRVSVRTTRR